MSSEVKGQLVIFSCDECGDTYEAAGSWKDVWEAARQDGWRAFKSDDEEWQHACPSCRN